MTTANILEAGSRHMSKSPSIDPGLKAVLEALTNRADSDDTIASKTELADALGITKQALSQWRHVPIEHVLAIESLLLVPRHVQRPDVYPDPSKDVAYAHRKQRSRTAPAR